MDFSRGRFGDEGRRAKTKEGKRLNGYDFAQEGATISKRIRNILNVIILLFRTGSETEEAH